MASRGRMARWSRRRFLAMTALSPVAVRASASPALAPSKPVGAPSVCVFSKHLQFLDYADLARTCRELGLDGVDLTVRQGGHVVPERAAEDLQRAADAIRGEGIGVPMVTTSFADGADPRVRAVLEQLSRQGIPYFRCGGLRYDFGLPIADQLAGFAARLRSLAQTAEQAGVTAGYHNHSGGRNVGAPLWDLHEILCRVGSPALGSNFDAGHAVVEGGLGAWEINARLLAPHVRMMAVKDFVWIDGEVRWVPLGKGQVDLTAILRIMRAAGFAGPISMHFEYDTPSRDALFEHVRTAAGVLRRCLAEAGYPMSQA